MTETLDRPTTQDGTTQNGTAGTPQPEPQSVFQQKVDALQKDWDTNPRWSSITRDYSAAEVVKLQGTVQEEQTLARRGAEKLWKQLTEEHAAGKYTNSLGALSGNQP